MRKEYITPAMQVMDIQSEKEILLGTSVENAGETDAMVKKDFSTGIEFDDLSGTDIVKRNPWDSQW